jgi:outer membrane lipopolysaccharide assembly protein LptE/RlpB
VRRLTRPLQWALLALLAGGAIGCGWQLRGAGLEARDIAGITVEASASDRDIALQLARTLAPLVAVNNAAADHTVTIEQFSSQARVATVSAAIRSAEQQLNMALTFSFKRGDDFLIRSQTIALERLYRTIETDILASKNERRLVEHEMRSELVAQLVRQLAALPVAD